MSKYLHSRGCLEECVDCDVVLHRSDQMGNDGSGRGEGRGREGGGVGGEARMGKEEEEEEKRGVRRGGRGGALSESEQ